MLKSRRDFLGLSGRALGAAAVSSLLEQFGLVNYALALEEPVDYRALVCVFLFGGNDGNNTVIPYDDYADYAAVRGSLAIPKADLLQISPRGTPKLGLHPSFTGLHGLWQEGKLAILANTGPLAEPVTKAEYLAGAPRPENLFSHSDQQAQFQSATVSLSGVSAPTGWGGRLADATADMNGDAAFEMLVSTSGVPLFATGLTSRPFVPGTALSGYGSTSASVTARYNALREIQNLDGSSNLVAASGGITSAAIDSVNTLNQALSGLQPLTTTFPATSLGNQMKQIASIIAARRALSVRRQIFFASLGGFDTHNGQLGTQQNLLTQLSQALTAFYGATVEMGVASSVTTFSLTDFGRTYKPAAGGGTDHAWGNHQFVLGGSVSGGEIYGTFPRLSLGGPDDTGTEGRWIPTTSVDQFAATLALWFGLPPARVHAVFPNLVRFSPQTLGFLG